MVSTLDRRESTCLHGSVCHSRVVSPHEDRWGGTKSEESGLGTRKPAHLSTCFRSGTWQIGWGAWYGGLGMGRFSRGSKAPLVQVQNGLLEMLRFMEIGISNRPAFYCAWPVLMAILQPTLCRGPLKDILLSQKHSAQVRQLRCCRQRSWPWSLWHAGSRLSC